MGLYNGFVVVILLLSSTYVCSKSPNIVFIMMDDVGWNDVGYHGSSISTPHIDKLANDGVKLDNYYVSPVCTPTRGMFLTGKHMIHLRLQNGIIHGLERKCLPVHETTVAQKLQELNYETHAIGKWHVGYYETACLPNKRGFDHFFGIIGGETNHYTYKNGLFWDLYRDEESVAHDYYGQYSTDLYAKEARSVIANHDTDKPLFLYLAFQAAHVPLQAPDKYMDMYSHIKHLHRRTFSAMVTCMDDAIGSVVDQLKESDMWDNTVLVVSTDNGGAAKIWSGNNWPLKGAKAALWEGGVRGVSFVSSPLLDNAAKGSTNRELMYVTDWLPTFVRLAGGSSKELKSMNLDGVDQWDTISHGKPTTRDHVLLNLNTESHLNGANYDEPWLGNKHFDVQMHSGIRIGDWKLLTGHQAPETWYPDPESGDTPVHRNNNKIVRLYNIAEDPTEANDLSESMPDKVLECLKRLEKYRQTVLPLLHRSKINQEEALRFMPNNILAPWNTQL